MSAKRKLCVVTGTRAEYGLLYWLMKEIEADADLELQVLVTGMHLSPDFGLTHREIEADGFLIAAKVPMLIASDTPEAVAKSVGLGVTGIAAALDRLKPDIMVVLGDRFEILAAAQAALLAGIPIAHIHGGESTEGAFDEAIRHAVTKMAQWHFVAAEAYRKRVVQLGEAPERVFNFGAPGLDHLEHLDWMDRATLEKSLGIALKPPVLLVTYHPATRGDGPPVAAMDELLLALDDHPEATIIFTHPNADPGGRALVERMERWVEANKHRSRALVSLGQQRYLSLMREADLVLGNSSSALTEAPALKKAAVNIGDRQKGRLMATSVIAARESRADIAAAIEQALSPEFRRRLEKTESLYGSGGVSVRIKKVLKSVSLDTRKAFFDIEHAY